MSPVEHPYFEGSAVVSQHTEAPLVPVQLFHVRNISMKYLSMFVTDGAKILREEVLGTILHPIAL
jgi:hypothetical protein